LAWCQTSGARQLQTLRGRTFSNVDRVSGKNRVVVLEKEGQKKDWKEGEGEKEQGPPTTKEKTKTKSRTTHRNVPLSSKQKKKKKDAKTPLYFGAKQLKKRPKSGEKKPR